ncbi:hypothetical protein LC612_33085 [Nostoc sp. CHAB 5834]|nr:hypothetical protein [Nostoc sp. CHAB 5834]
MKKLFASLAIMLAFAFTVFAAHATDTFPEYQRTQMMATANGNHYNREVLSPDGVFTLSECFGQGTKQKCISTSKRLSRAEHEAVIAKFHQDVLDSRKAEQEKVGSVATRQDLNPIVLSPNRYRVKMHTGITNRPFTSK